MSRERSESIRDAAYRLFACPKPESEKHIRSGGGNYIIEEHAFSENIEMILEAGRFC